MSGESAGGPSHKRKHDRREIAEYGAGRLSSIHAQVILRLRF